MENHQPHGPIPAHTNAGGKSLNPFDDDCEAEALSEANNHYYHQEDIAVQQLEQAWKNINSILLSPSIDPFVMGDLKEQLSVVEKLLVKDIPESSSQIGACLRYMLSENVVENIYMFSTRQKVYSKEIRIMLLRFLAEVLTRSSQPVLIHQQVLRPISKLLRACEGINDSEMETSMVPLLHAMCILMQENQSLLDLFFIDSPVHMQSRFLVFTQLVPHLHGNGEIGNRARDAILLCLSLADQLPGSNLTHFIASECNFCQVLATGLSALYSDLPSTCDLVVDEWQSPLPVVEAAVPELHTFLQALDYCNSVLQMAPKLVCTTMLSLVSEGFLQQVMGPALLQPSDNAVMFSTAYVTIFLQHITNVSLMRAFLHYLLRGSYDNRSIVQSLVQNIGKPNPLLCAITLEFFYALLNLNCEDVLLELVLKYLLPGNHILPNQLAIVGSPDIYSQAARKLLQLLPTSCIEAEGLFLESLKKTPGGLSSPQGTVEDHSGTPPPPTFTSSPLVARGHQLEWPTPTPRAPLTNLSVPLTPTPPHIPSPSHHHQPICSTNPFDNPLPISHPSQPRSRSDSDASSSSLVSMSSVSSSVPQAATNLSLSGGELNHSKLASNPPAVLQSSSNDSTASSSFQFEYVSPEMAYLSYLVTSRESIRECTVRSRCWSCIYDKCEISKKVQQELSNRKATKSLEMEDMSSVEVRVTNEEEESTAVGANDDDSGLRSFRSRATTLSHSKISRTTSLRAHNRLHSSRATGAGETTHKNGEEGETTAGGTLLYNHAQRNPSELELSSGGGQGGLRRSGTISSGGSGRQRRGPSSPRVSPKLGRKTSSSYHFEDRIGLFLKVVMDKLMDMMEQQPIVNILMTRLISRLAYYPQPLIRSLLLNHQLVLKPGIPNLFSVIQFLKQTVDRYARTQEGFEKRLGRARKTMIYRAQVRNHHVHSTVAKHLLLKHLRQNYSRSELDILVPSRQLPAPVSLSASPSSAFSVLTKRNSKQSLLSDSSRLKEDGGSGSGLGTQEAGNKQQSKKKAKKVSTDTLYAVVIFYEFVRELAAISEEHSVFHSLLYLPNSSCLAR